MKFCLRVDILTALEIKIAYGRFMLAVLRMGLGIGKRFSVLHKADGNKCKKPLRIFNSLCKEWNCSHIAV